MQPARRTMTCRRLSTVQGSSTKRSMKGVSGGLLTCSPWQVGVSLRRRRPELGMRADGPHSVAGAMLGAGIKCVSDVAWGVTCGL